MATVYDRRKQWKIQKNKGGNDGKFKKPKEEMMKESTNKKETTVNYSKTKKEKKMENSTSGKATYRDFGIDLSEDETGRHSTTCPKCSSDRKKSSMKCLGIDADRQIWHCNHCGWSGSLKTKTKELKMENSKKAIGWETGKKLPPKIVKWFKDRGISEKTLLENDIQYKESVYFPQIKKKSGAICYLYKQDGKVIDVKFRGTKKCFKTEINTKKILYGVDDVPKEAKEVTILEGENDVLACREAGIISSVSVPNGAPAPGSEKFNSKFKYLENCELFLKRFQKIILAVDNDPAGKVLENELAHRIGHEKCWYVEYPDGCKDANDVLVKFGAEKLREVIKKAKPFPLVGVSLVEDLDKEISFLYNNGFPPVYSTGWKTLDKLYQVRSGELTIITGFPGHGKSEFSDALVLNLAMLHQWIFGICSLENLPYERHAIKFIEKETGKPFYKGPSPRMTATELSKAKTVLNDSLNFINPESIDIDTILATAKSLIFRRGIKGLIIDPYNEIDHKRPTGMSETEYISQFLSKVRRFARLNNICVWVIAHPVKPPREDRDKPPTVYDISGSANWANKADNVISVFRHADDNIVEVNVQKIRFKEVGKIGSVDLIYDNLSGRYQDKSQSPQKWNNVQSATIKKAKK